ncbi:MAG TPA: septum formation initiator family protein [Mobilitalea sp.]|nr:septum formation initiator family protein [Mobilitalea sp.]
MEANKRRYQYGSSGTSYVEGNTVRKLNTAPERRREEREYEVPAPRRRERTQPKTLSGINLASLLVLSVAMITTLYMCVEYLKLQANMTQMNHNIVTLEQTLKSKTKENDIANERINTVYDLDYVYKVAVDELGMVYPNKNKVITYQSGKEDYVRQYQDIPE